MLKKKLGPEAIERDWVVYHIGDYFKVPSTLIVLEGCRRIGDYAFEYCNRLEKVLIPKSVERIGVKAFWKCWRAVVILRKSRSEFEYISPDALFWCDVLVEEKDVKEEVRN